MSVTPTTTPLSLADLEAQLEALKAKEAADQAAEKARRKAAVEAMAKCRDEIARERAKRKKMAVVIGTWIQTEAPVSVKEAIVKAGFPECLKDPAERALFGKLAEAKAALKEGAVPPSKTPAKDTPKPPSQTPKEAPVTPASTPPQKPASTTPADPLNVKVLPANAKAVDGQTFEIDDSENNRRVYAVGTIIKDPDLMVKRTLKIESVTPASAGIMGSRKVLRLRVVKA